MTVLNGLNRFIARARDAIGGRADAVGVTCREIPASEHGIDRAAISANALKVLNRLRDGGYKGYVVGGGVRDLLLGREPKDFDIATDALPEQVKRLFRNSRLIGRRFRLAHVHFGRDIIEVATFRANTDDGSGDRRLESGRLVRDNVYGTIEEDAVRRDFTVNALYYDAHENVVLDFTSGFEDLKSGLLRLIGDPDRRYREDPVRMLRAARFAAKLGFRVHPRTEAPIAALGKRLSDIAPARIYEECLKLFLTGHALASFEILRHYDLFRYLFPDTDACLSEEEEGYPRTLVSRALANTDERVAQGKPVVPAFLFAVFLWHPMRERAAELMDEGMQEREAMEVAAEQVMSRQVRHVAVPKRTSWPMREIWFLQPRFRKRQGKAALKLLQHPRFRAAYDFLLLRAEGDPELKEQADFWTEIQNVPENEQKRRLLGGGKKKRGRRRKRKKKAPAGSDT